MNIRRAAVALGIAMAAIGTTAVAAQADSLSATCSADGHTLNATAYYVNSGAYHVWTSMSYKVSGGELGSENDVFWSIKEDNRTIFGDSDTALPANTWRNKPTGTNPRTYGGYPEWVVFRAVFDEPFQFDPECSTVTRKI
ncbi:hypothetical protein [Lentzea flava]|nr:hypothetical protein [Lentzea flava]